MDLTPRQAFGGSVHPDHQLASIIGLIDCEAPDLPIPAELSHEPVVTLHIGRHQGIPVSSAEEASRIWQMYREGLNLGGSESPKVLLKCEGKTVGYVSYNGRVWKGLPKMTASPLVAEAASLPTSVRVGDWIPVEDMERGTLKLVQVVAVWPNDGGAVSFDVRPGERIYYHPKRMHQRYFAGIHSIHA